MHSHAASGLRGPFSRGSDCWPRQLELPDPVASEPASADPGDPDIRWDLVQRIRQAIAEGTYETPEKLEQALEQLRRELE
jgi:hypothetical protein